MTEVSIAEARNRLTRLVQRAEAGETVRITRRGRPVAVLLSEREYGRLSAPRSDLAGFLAAWRADMETSGIPFPDEDTFARVRDNAPPGPSRQAVWE
jgi:prevent-host-death family protein